MLGPQTSLPSPMTAILDGAVQRVPLSTQADDNGCGILYVLENLTDSPHTLVLVYHAQTGSVDFGVSGIRRVSFRAPPYQRPHRSLTHPTA